MKHNIFSINAIQSTHVCLIESYLKVKLMMGQSLMMVSLFVALVFSACNVNAEELWNNGNTDGNYLGWGQYSSTLDDFYVPGGGWWVNHLETSGFFIDPSTVDEVEVAIWTHDIQENKPNGSEVVNLTGVTFEATATGNKFFNKEEIKISVDFDETYLQGQEYYWVEITVRDPQGIEDFRFLARQNILHEPSWTHFGQGSLSPSDDVYGNALDLSFALYGNPVTLKFDSPVDDFKVEGSDRKGVFGVKKVFMPNVNTLGGLAIRCPDGTSLTPFEMPIYDDNGLFVVRYETVWNCISDDNKPAG